MKRLSFLLIIFQSLVSLAQTHSLKGIVFDEKPATISYATVALLDAKDSTMLFYSITNSTGEFEIKNITDGKYILQSAFLGYKTFYQEIYFPFEKEGKLFTIVMEPKPVSLPAAEINAERIPLLIRGDTIEYNAGSYKTKTDAVAEDLLKKLPGVVIDRNGNIKAQGEEVKKVTVDGKEFFGNDPKVATKNLPADAINKVQVFDTKSDQAELTGINDGKRDKTINLELKDDKKTAWFGDVLAGGGSGEHYQTAAKAYRFTPDKQIAILGMLNNINKFGFSFSDYMNFNGGFGGSGNSFRLSSDDNSFPIDFGEIQNGKITSGSVGANYSKEIRKDNRYNFSYLANGMNKELKQHEVTANFTEANPFTTDQYSNQNDKNRAHRLNFGWKNRIDTTHTFNLSGQGSLNYNDQSNTSSLSNYSGTVLSDQSGKNSISGNTLNSSIHTSYLTKMYSAWKLLSLQADGSWKHGLSQNDINTLTKVYSPPDELSLNQFQKIKNDEIIYSGSAAITRRTGKLTYLEGGISAGAENENYERDQGLVPESDGLIDSLSGNLRKDYYWIEPEFKFKRISEKTQFTLSLAAQYADMHNDFDSENKINLKKTYFLPSISWEKEYKSAHRLRIFYQSNTVTPKAKELYPLTNIFDPLNLTTGNRNLKPEVHHDLRMHWNIFDQFSFTSIFAGLQFSYVKDKMNWSKTINENLVQSNSLINVPEDYRAGFSAEYSTPIRKLGVNVTLSIDESWNKSFTYINDVLNKNTGINHELSLSFDNRKKNKWETAAGISVRQQNSVISLPKNHKQTFVKGNVFADINFNPNDHWQFSAKADLSQYYGKTLEQKTYVPLLQAEVSYIFLKNNRGMLTLTGFDLLNKNTGVERTSEYNYVRETHSDIIQRYLMLSFKYKLNKFNSGSKVDVKVNGH